MDQLVKNAPTMLETQVGSLGWEGGIIFLPVGGNSSAPPCSFLENPMDRGPWQITVHRVAKSHSKKHDWSDLAAAASLHIALHKQIFLLLRDFPFCLRPDWNWLLKSGWIPLSKAEKTSTWVISTYMCVCTKSLQLCLTLCDPMGKDTGVGCHVLLQGIFLTQGRSPHLLCLLHWDVGFFTSSATWEGSSTYIPIRKLRERVKLKSVFLISQVCH